MYIKALRDYFSFGLVSILSGCVGSQWLGIVARGHERGFRVAIRIARFKPKNPDLGKFWRVFAQVRCWYIMYMSILSILWLFGKFCGHLLYFMDIWYTYLFPVLVCCTEKNLATLVAIMERSRRRYVRYLMIPYICTKNGRFFWPTGTTKWLSALFVQWL
jgi:hypothetical protein